jgi:hypothetical protein
VSAWRWTVLLASFGCATSGPATTELDAHFDAPAAQQAQSIALDLYARAQTAREAAHRAKHPTARAEHAERAWLWLQAAIVEAERVEIERGMNAARARARQAAEARAREAHALQAAQNELARVQAARAAAERDALAGQPHPRGTPRAERARLDARAAARLRERSRLVLAAAMAMGADDTQQQPVRAWIARSEAAHAKPRAQRAAAERALEAAERALEIARAAGQPPSGEAAPR